MDAGRMRAVMGVLVTLLTTIAISSRVNAVWTSPNPGFKARITQAGFKFLNDVGVKLLTEDIQGQTIPDISGTAKISIGKVDYTVSSMRITGFNVPRTSLATDPGVGLQFVASGGSISLHGDWRYKYKKGFIKISDHGSFDASASNLNLNLAVKLGKDSKGRPTIAPAKCYGDIGSLKITLHGGASWLYNLFSSSIENALRDSLNGKICDMVNQEINTRAAQALASMKIITPVGPYTELDYSLVADPLFDKIYMETSHKGEFYPTGKHDREAPYKVPAIPVQTQPVRWFTCGLPITSSTRRVTSSRK
ncbi:bactericidal permeability-increasing protein-like isoform X1 [Ptychodera flava]|uniref:bactericidal permeability-increasing protein-like isoform X1 n=1 Tax=Ptychodera flava TaxID=63121 RepID=UPI00396A4C5B